MTEIKFHPDPIEKLLLYDGIGESLCLAQTRTGRPAGLFIERWHEKPYFLHVGLEAEGIVRDIMPSQNGAFIGVQHGVEVWAFMTLKSGAKLNIGERLPIRVVSEPHSNKFARVVRRPPPPKQPTSPPSALDCWRSLLVLPDQIAIEHSESVDAFEDALEWGEVLNAATPNGASVKFGLTDALTAIDIDTNKWHVKQPPHRRARAVNAEAIHTVARELSYRSIGGISVLDCIGPIAAEDRNPLKDLMMKAWRTYRHGPMQVLSPSPLGLMEMSFARTTAPLHTRLFDPNTRDLSPASIALRAFRRGEMEAKTNRAQDIRITLPDDAFAWHKENEKTHMEAFLARYGARISVEHSPE